MAGLVLPGTWFTSASWVGRSAEVGVKIEMIRRLCGMHRREMCDGRSGVSRDALVLMLRALLVTCALPYTTTIVELATVIV